jgi:hypothetical protein
VKYVHTFEPMLYVALSITARACQPVSAAYRIDNSPTTLLLQMGLLAPSDAL